MKLPRLVEPLEIPVVLGAFAGPRPEALGPNLIRYVPAPEAAEPGTTGFEEELLDEVRSAADIEPPAPVHPLLEIEPRLAAVVPPPAAPVAELAAVALVAGPSPVAELPVLRAKLANGPNPSARAAPEPAKAEPPKAQPAAKEPAKPEAAKADPPKPKITIRPPDSPKMAKPEVRRPATIAARGNAAPAAVAEQPVAAPEPAPPAKPVVIPIRKTDPAVVPAARAESVPGPTLGLGASQPASGAGMKIGAVAAGLIVMAGGAWFFLRGNDPSQVDAAARARSSAEVVEPLPALGGAGWSSNWGADAATNKGKQISIFRPSMAIPDYRIELHGQIERKALGWVFRARDPKNYYVMKLEWIKPGPQPITALIKYAVVDGKETTRTQVLLSLPAISLSTMYRIRTDVKGNKFTTYVNDQLVDYWTDDRLKVGGAGIYVDPGERALVKTTSIAGLR
jgi:hypothetical protein